MKMNREKIELHEVLLAKAGLYEVVYKDMGFPIYIGGDKKKLSVWGGKAETSLGEWDIIDWNNPELLSRMDAIIEGFTPCTKCGRRMKKDEISLEYFAGRYCEDCATPELRARKKSDYVNLD